MTKKLLFIFGTRPEAIKMAPVIIAAQKRKEFVVEVCTTGQHKEILHYILQFFKIAVNYEINIMRHNQTLFDITTLILDELKVIIPQSNPDYILVQGDTSTAFTGALAGFYSKVKVAHIEAGLRSFDNYAPYPEEANRKMISAIADIHFAPTAQAIQFLETEKPYGKIVLTGNTVIDALHIAVKKTNQNNHDYQSQFNEINFQNKIILITTHRRENFGAPLLEICRAIKDISDKFNNVEIILPVHPNPNVKEIIEKELSSIRNIHLIRPLNYDALVWLMNQSFFILTDSGGIQEEAPALGKPVLVMREVTERPEGVETGNAVLVGTSYDKILNNATSLLTDASFYNQMSQAANPYGDGTAAEKILDYLATHSK